MAILDDSGPKMQTDEVKIERRWVVR